LSAQFLSTRQLPSHVFKFNWRFPCQIINGFISLHLRTKCALSSKFLVLFGIKLLSETHLVLQDTLFLSGFIGFDVLRWPCVSKMSWRISNSCACLTCCFLSSISFFFIITLNSLLAFPSAVAITVHLGVRHNVVFTFLNSSCEWLLLFKRSFLHEHHQRRVFGVCFLVR